LSNFDFSLPFSIHDDNEILKRMGLNDVQFVEKLERAQQQQQIQQQQQQMQQVQPGKENMFPHASLPYGIPPQPLVQQFQQQPQPNARPSYPQPLVQPQAQNQFQNTQGQNQQTQQYHSAQPLV